MDRIQFCSVIPEVFSHQENLNSEIWNTDVCFEKGHLYLIEADSGKGKSTFCSYIVGYRHDYSGQVLFDTQDTKAFKVKQWVNIRKEHISHLFQELRLFPESEKQIAEWFEALGIADKLNEKIGHMSFGQQQRVAMIRALVQPFDFIIVDEPISHLDDTNAEIMGHIMMNEAKAQGAGVIVTSIGKHMNLNYEQTFKL